MTTNKWGIYKEPETPDEKQRAKIARRSLSCLGAPPPVRFAIEGHPELVVEIPMADLYVFRSKAIAVAQSKLLQMVEDAGLNADEARVLDVSEPQ